MHKYPHLIIKNTSYILYILIFQRILLIIINTLYVHTHTLYISTNTISTNDYNIKYRFISIKPAQNSFPGLYTITHTNRFQRFIRGLNSSNRSL